MDETSMRLFLDCVGHVPAFPLADMSASGKAPTCRSTPPQRPFPPPAGNAEAEPHRLNEMGSGGAFQLSQSARGGKADAGYLEARTMKLELR